MGEGFPLGAAQRAFGALTFNEERHAILAKAHLAFTCHWRKEHLDLQGASLEDAMEAGRAAAKFQEELRKALDTTASEDVLADEEVMRVALTLPNLKNDRDVFFKAFQAKREVVALAGDLILADRDTVLKIVSMHGRALEHASGQLQGDKEVVLAAIASDAWALEYASTTLKEDREVVLAAISRQTLADITANQDNVLCFASQELRNDKEVVLAAVACDAWAFQYASQALKADREVVLAALRTQSRQDVLDTRDNIFARAGRGLRADKELVLEAVRVDGVAVRIASPELRSDKDFILQAMRVAPPEERDSCYAEAHEGVRNSVSFEEFQGASESALATAGDSAPVLTISASGEPTSSATATHHHEVTATFLSGASFTCSLLPPATSDEDQAASTSVLEPAQEPPIPAPAVVEQPSVQQPSAQNDEETAQRRSKSTLVNLERPAQHGEMGQKRPNQTQYDDQQPVETEESPPKRPKLAKASVASSIALTVAQLAKLVLRGMEAEPPPDKVFLLFEKCGDAANTVPVTPWDWNRPLSDFL